MNYGLPTTAIVGGKEYRIRSDWRAILDIISALNDTELTEQEKAVVALSIFFPDYDRIPQEHVQSALIECFSFISLGATEEEMKNEPKRPKLMDWEQDFQLIIAPVNKVAGCEIRALEYLHWWTFMSYYNEIDGECMFSRVVGIRDKKVRGKSLDKEDRAFYNRNRKLIDFKVRYTEAEEDTLALWTGKTNG